MRFIYTDEAGTSRKDPVAIVAGVIVHADREWRRLEAELGKLVVKYVPEEKRKGFCFHAKDLANGSEVFPKDKWPVGARMAIIRELLTIPWNAHVPIIYGYYRRDKLPASEKIVQSNTHLACAIAAEQFMREHVPPEEIGTMVAEDNPSARSSIKSFHNALRSGDFLVPMLPDINQYLPLTRIIDTVHFAQKREAVLLQLADMCAFTAKRTLAGNARWEDLYRAMAPGTSPPSRNAAGGYQILWNRPPAPSQPKV